MWVPTRSEAIANAVQLDPLPERPLVSVIVPSFNQGRFIRHTIESTLSQSYRPLELLVIDGASTDETVEVLKSFDSAPELRWWSEPDSGIVEAVNKGFARARGQIGAIQSSDDSYLPGAVEGLVAALKRSPEVGLVYGDGIKVDPDGNELARSQTGPFSIENFLCKRTNVIQGAAAFRMELVRELGGWDERFFNADTELWLRMIFCARALKLDAFLCRRTMHGEQRDQQAAQIVESYWRMMHTSVEVQNGPRCWRRAAQCGKYLHAVRYNPSDSDWMATYYLWRAIWAKPSTMLSSWRSLYFIPGYLPLRRALSRLKRTLLRAKASRVCAERRGGGDPS